MLEEGVRKNIEFRAFAYSSQGRTNNPSVILIMIRSSITTLAVDDQHRDNHNNGREYTYISNIHVITTFFSFKFYVAFDIRTQVFQQSL